MFQDINHQHKTIRKVLHIRKLEFDPSRFDRNYDKLFPSESEAKTVNAESTENNSNNL